MDDLVYFVCEKQGLKLRVRITSQGYYRYANCQFPRVLREDGRRYSAPKEAVTFARASGTLFYRVKKNSITIIDDINVITEKIKNLKVYDVDDRIEECTICMENKKEIVFIPCGHYCACMSCYKQIGKICPSCRQKITDHVTYDELIKINNDD